MPITLCTIGSDIEWDLLYAVEQKIFSYPFLGVTVQNDSDECPSFWVKIVDMPLIDL